MALHTDDRLQSFFPGWVLDDRSLVWLWLQLNKHGAGFHEDDFNTLDIREEMANYLTDNEDLIRKIERAQKSAFIPEHDLRWIDKSGRQPTWLLKQHLDTIPQPPQLPSHLTTRERLITLLDFCDGIVPRKQDTIGLSPQPQPDLTTRESLMAIVGLSDTTISTKQDALKDWQAAWVQHQVDDRYFNWYSIGSEEKQKCRIAWQWYQDNHRLEASYAEAFSKPTDVLEFLDDTSFSLDEKRFHLEEIKKKFKAQQIAAKRKDKKQTNLSLSDDARKKLDFLAKRRRMTKTELIELLIENAHERDVF